MAFGLTTSSGEFIYAPTALYIAKTPGSPAKGPFLAPADPMSVAPQYRSKQNSGPGGIKAIYAARVPVPHAGTFTVLALTRTAKGLIGSPGEIAVTATSPIPNVGQRPPDIATDTLATVGGNVSLLTTRRPPEQMHSVSFNQVLGKKPVALLFSTPQFCVSRVCGPVTDVAVQLQHEFGNKITFIHEEVYADNQPSKGLRSQMKAFHLRTEPWLFAINRHGVIVARLEGAFGTTELTQALKAALRVSASRLRRLLVPAAARRLVAAIGLAACGSSSGGAVTAPPVQPARVFTLGDFSPTGTIQPHRPVTMTFTVQLPSGKPLTQYKTGPGPHTGVHLIIVRDDLAYIIHDHPPIEPNGVLHQTVTFPAPGPYRVLVDVYPEHPRRAAELPAVSHRSRGRRLPPAAAAAVQGRPDRRRLSLRHAGARPTCTRSRPRSSTST